MRLPAWDAQFQVPDVVGFADFVQFGELLCADLSDRCRSYVPDRLEIFPYPNGRKLRAMAVARCPDLVMSRAAGGRIIRRTDALLSDRVLAARLDPHGPSPWSFKDPWKAWARFRDMPNEVARDSPLAEAWVTDVASYFGSIDYHLLATQMHERRCDLDAVSLVMNFLTEWAKGGELHGLPVGPELSSVLGNAFLEPLDAALVAEGVAHFRYMDDVVVIGEDLQEEQITATVDRTLETLGLVRNVDKTHSYRAGMAAEALQDMLLAYVDPRGEVASRRMEPGELRDLLGNEVEEAIPNPKRVRFALRGLRDGTAIPHLVEHQRLLNSSPRETGAYMGTHGMRNQEARDALMEAVANPGDDNAAMRLHSLRACQGASWGRSEGEVFMSIATSRNERSPVRAHAWHAARRSPSWRADVAMEAADQERHPVVRRSIVLTLRCAGPTRSKVALMKEMAKDPHVQYAARWASIA
ncbi:MAG: RNA-directed DNA polymerase [Actinomycetota bacterium]|nr:RNA-directed DNA polymerase [Actinomycetota bacterium]